MALYLIDKLHTQAKNASKEDISKLCSSLLDALSSEDKSAESLTMLRQLYFILEARDTDSCSVPDKLIIQMIKTVCVADKGKQFKECILCQRILQEFIPLPDQVIKETEPLQSRVPNVFSLQLLQNQGVGCINEMFSKAVSWLQAQSSSYEVQRKAFTFLVGVSNLHSQIPPVKVKSVNDIIGGWLMTASLYQAPNPYTSNPFRKDENNLVTEVDGTTSTNFFTVLNIGQYYTDDQLANICAFSMLYTWIHHTCETLNGLNIDTEALNIELQSEVKSSTPISTGLKPPSHSALSRSASSEILKHSPRHSPLSLKLSLPVQSGRPLTPTQQQQQLQQSLSRPVTPSGSSRSSSPVFTEEVSKVAMATDAVGVSKLLFQALIGRTLDYCFRILDQCDRKPKTASDVDLQNACMLETVRLLDLVCTIDRGQVPRTFRELKRLSSQTNSDQANRSLQIALLQFLLNHSGSVAYDPQEELRDLFHKVVSRSFNNHTTSFDVVLFILDNLETLTFDHSIMSVYFPNILKILAWSPHTFVSEFTDLLPVMMSASTSLEVFHSLIDLPCMTISLEVTERMKNVEFTNVAIASGDQDPSSALEAFKNPMFRPMFNFFTRGESGHGDTISRLDKFHQAIQDMMEHPRVLVCYQVVPVLLRVWFDVVLQETSLEFVVGLVPALLERSLLLYGIAEYQSDVRRILSENVIQLIRKYPEVILRQRREICDFLCDTRNISGREDFYCHLVWGVGEYTSAVYDRECQADTVGQVYEALEVIMYEVIVITSSTPSDKAPYTVKVVSTLMTALAKLASRCQDLIPRAILCLTKVAKSHQTDMLELIERNILLNTAQELINLLKLPNFASVILNSPINFEGNRVHRDPTSMASVLRATHRLVSPSV